MYTTLLNTMPECLMISGILLDSILFMQQVVNIALMKHVISNARFSIFAIFLCIFAFCKKKINKKKQKEKRHLQIFIKC